MEKGHSSSFNYQLNCKKNFIYILIMSKVLWFDHVHSMVQKNENVADMKISAFGLLTQQVMLTCVYVMVMVNVM
jgi:hypothetical protein